MSNLKLEVLLAAKDKLTASLKSARTGNRELAQAVKETKDQLKQLNRTQADINGFKELRTGAAVTEHQLKSARERVQELGAAMAKVDTPTKAMTREFKAATQAAQDLAARKAKLAARLKDTEIRLRQAGIETKDLGTHQRQLSDAVASANAKLKEQEAELAKVNQRQQKLIALNARHGKEMTRVAMTGAAGAGMMATGIAAGRLMGKPIGAYADAEDAAASLKASMMQQGGAIGADFERINALAAQLGNRLPGTTADFQNMMTMLRRQGMSATAILGGLGEATAYLGVQLKMPVTEAAEFASKLQDATKTSEKDMMGLMDVIQRTYYLGVDSGNMLQGFAKLSSALDIIKQKGLGGAKALAPLLVMADQAGMSGESAGNAYRKLFQYTMDKKRVQSLNNDMKAGHTGLTFDFTNGKGEFGGMDKLFAELGKLKSLNTQARQSAIKTLFGDDAETLQAVSLLIDKGQSGYAEVQAKMAAQASLQERVNVQLGTLRNLWDAASGTFTNALVAFGEAIAPELKAITDWIGRASEALGTWAKENPRMASALMKLAGLFAIAATALGALAIGLAGIIGPLLMSRFMIAQLGIRFDLLGRAAGIAKTGLVALRAGLLFVGEKLSWLGRIATANPIGIAIMAIALAALLIYKFWKPIKAFFSGLFDGLTEAFAPLGTIFDSVKTAFAPLQPLFSALGDLMGGLFSQYDASSDALNGWAAAGYAVGKVLGWIIKAAIFPFTLAIKTLVAIFSTLSFGVGYVFGELKAAFAGGLAEIGKLLINWSPIGLFYSAFSTVLSWFGVELPAKFTDFGSQIMKGLVNGILSGISWVKNGIRSVVDGATDLFKELLGIHSPSRVFADLGGYTMAGLDQGLSQGQDEPLRTVRDTAKRLAAVGAGISLGASVAIADPTHFDNRQPITVASASHGRGQGALAPPGITQGGDTYIINVYPGGNADIAQQIRRELEAIQREKAARGRSRLVDHD